MAKDLIVEMAEICTPTGGTGDDIFVLAGRKLTPAQAAILETMTAKNPEDLKSRLKLLGFYYTRQFRSNKAAQSRHRHILWMIDHRTTDYVTGQGWCSYSGFGARNELLEAKKHWSKLIADSPNDPEILANASQFLAHDEMDEAEALLLRAKHVDPKNPRWPLRLAFRYMLRRFSAPKSMKKVYARKALLEGELAFRLEQNAHARYLRIPDLGWMAFLADDLTKARRYAELTLKTGRRLAKDIEKVRSTHEAHVLLGSVCLAQDDIAGARHHLLSAAPLPMIGPTDSVTPNMTLAKALLERGQKHVVVKFLKSCSAFTAGWKDSELLLKKWLKTVQAGSIPRFKGRFHDYVRR